MDRDLNNTPITDILTSKDFFIVEQDNELKKIDTSILQALKGRDIQLRRGVNSIQFKYSDEKAWTNLISFNELKGKDADNIELRKTDNFIQWKKGEGQWFNLIDIQELVPNDMVKMSSSGRGIDDGGKNIPEFEEATTVNKEDYFILEQQDGTKKLSIAQFDDRIKVSTDTLDYTNSSDPNISSVKDALDKLLYSHLTISLSANKSLISEKGIDLSGIVFNWTYNKDILSQSFDDKLLDRSIRTYTEKNTLRDNKTYSLITNDGKSTFSKSLSFEFIYPIYIGSVSNEYPTEEDIKTMTKKIVKPSNQTFNYTIDNECMCIAVPYNWNIKKIIDPNNFDITSSFTLSDVSIVCLDVTTQSYKVYVSEPTSQTNFSVVFSV